MSEEISIKLTNYEILFLAALLGNNEFLGVKDIMASLTKEEVKNVMTATQQQLQDKGLIQVGLGGSIVVDQLIHAIVQTCCKCDSYIILQRTKENSYSEYHYYITEFLAVQMESDPEEEETFILKLIPSVKKLQDLIKFNLGLAPITLNSAEKFTIPEHTIEKVKEVANDDRLTALNLLKEAGASPEIAGEITDLMAKPYIYTSFLIMEFGQEQTGSISEGIFIQSKKYLWQVKPVLQDNETRLEFFTLSYGQALCNVDEALTFLDALYVHGRENV